jgi:hypothetical protein
MHHYGATLADSVAPDIYPLLGVIFMNLIFPRRSGRSAATDNYADVTTEPRWTKIDARSNLSLLGARRSFQRICVTVIAAFASVIACSPAAALEQCKTGFGVLRSVSNAVTPQFILSASTAKAGASIWPTTARPYAPNPETIALYNYGNTHVRYYPDRDRSTSPMYQIASNGSWVPYSPELYPEHPQRTELREWEKWETPCINAQGTISFHYYGMRADRCAELLSNEMFPSTRRFYVLRADGVDPRYSASNLSYGHIIDKISYRGGGDVPPGYTTRSTVDHLKREITISLDNKFLVCELGTYARPDADGVTAAEHAKGYLIVVDKATAVLNAGFKLSSGLAATVGVPQTRFDKKTVGAWSDADSSRSAITFNTSFFDCADDPRQIYQYYSCITGVAETTISHALKTNNVTRATGHGEPNLLRSFSWGASVNNPVSGVPKVQSYIANNSTLSESTPVPYADAFADLANQYNAIVGWAPNATPPGGDSIDRLNFVGVGADRLCIHVGGLHKRALVRALLIKAGCPFLQQVQFDGGGSSALSIRDLNGARYDLVRGKSATLPGGIQITAERAVPVVLHVR